MNKQPSRIGLYLVLIVFLVAGYFYLNNQVTTQSDYTIEALEQAAEEGKVYDAVIYQNREVPTGSVTAEIQDECFCPGQERSPAECISHHTPAVAFNRRSGYLFVHDDEQTDVRRRK